MSRTTRKSYNWYTKEKKYIRKHQRKSYRLRNRKLLSKGIEDVEKPPRTEGWLSN